MSFRCGFPTPFCRLTANRSRFWLTRSPRRRYTAAMTGIAAISACAKINLYLAIGDRRTDGFHPIASLFQAVTLADEVGVASSDRRGVRILGDSPCLPEENTAYKAAIAWLEAAREAGASPARGYDIRIAKRIPSQAGLGGASSDAAAVLRLLSELNGCGLPEERLRSIAAGVGSDVPFFLGTPCAAVTGRGERLEPLPGRSDYAIVVVEPGFVVSTKEAYAAIDEARAEGSIPTADSPEEMAAGLAEAARSYRDKPPSRWRYRNDFFDCMARRHPGLIEARDQLLRSGAEFSSMSGSGSCLFGVYADVEAAERASAALSTRYRTWAAFPVAAFPLAR